MPYCEQCGTEHKERYQFCENCGAGLIKTQPFVKHAVPMRNYFWLIAIVLIFSGLSIMASIPYLNRASFRKVAIKAKTDKPIAHEPKETQSLLAKINSREKLRGRATAINAAGKNGRFSFFIDNSVEIIIGREDFDKRLGMLEWFLSRKDTDLSNIEYIDLRFKDIVIKNKDKP